MSPRTNRRRARMAGMRRRLPCGPPPAAIRPTLGMVRPGAPLQTLRMRMLRGGDRRFEAQLAHHRQAGYGAGLTHHDWFAGGGSGSVW